MALCRPRVLLHEVGSPCARSAALALAQLGNAAPVSAASPIGSEFQVNTYTTNAQGYPTVASDSSGDFVVVWHSDGSAGSDVANFSIQGQRYDSNGSALGGQFQVNSYTTGGQRSPTVASDAAGNFVVVWNSGNSADDTSFDSVQGQRYDANGVPIGSQFQVNTYTTGSQTLPSVASDSAGSFVVVWKSDSSAGDPSDSIQGQRYDASGALLGGEFQINTYTTSQQTLPSVAIGYGGSFLVVWASLGSAGSDNANTSIQGQRYASNGSPLGGEFQINTYTTAGQFRPVVASDSAGGFIVVWESLGGAGSDSSQNSIQGPRTALRSVESSRSTRTRRAHRSSRQSRATLRATSRWHGRAAAQR